MGRSRGVLGWMRPREAGPREAGLREAGRGRPAAALPLPIPHSTVMIH